MMSPELRVLGRADKMPVLPDTEYLLSCNVQNPNELMQMIFQSVETSIKPWTQSTVYTLEGGDNSHADDEVIE
jgi:hypothetical protein